MFPQSNFNVDIEIWTENLLYRITQSVHIKYIDIQFHSYPPKIFSFLFKWLSNVYMRSHVVFLTNILMEFLRNNDMRNMTNINMKLLLKLKKMRVFLVKWAYWITSIKLYMRYISASYIEIINEKGVHMYSDLYFYILYNPLMNNTN